MTEGNTGSNMYLIIAAVAVVVIAVGAWFIFSGDEAPPKPIPLTMEPDLMPEPEPVAPASGQQDMVDPEPSVVLPLLGDSDGMVREGVRDFGVRDIEALLASGDLIRRFVAFTDGIANGRVATLPTSALSPRTPFMATQTGDDTYELDPASYARYNTATNMIASIDAVEAAEFYGLVSPLLQQAYEELGYGNKRFDDVVLDAIGKVIEAPQLNGPIMLERPSVMYVFADDSLESLDPVQKQMIRIGPANTARVQEKLKEVLRELRLVLGR